MCPAYISAQTGQLKGVVIDGSTRMPIARVSIDIPNVGSTTTSSNGHFIINFKNCRACALGNKVSINLYHPTYGYDLKDYTFDRSYTVSTLYLDKKNSVQVLGRVFNRATRDLLGGIKVTCQLNVVGFQEPVVVTDEFGKFKFIFSQQLVGRISFINLYFRDTVRCFKDEVISKPINELLDIDVLMEVGGSSVCCLPIAKDIVEKKVNNIIQCDADNGYRSTILDVILNSCIPNGGIIEIKGSFNGSLLFKYGGKFDGRYDPATNEITILFTENQFQGRRQMAQFCIDRQD